MGIQTVAECVEDEATLEALARISVEAADSAVSTAATGTFARKART